jgi:GNAT superfamily N-acetyltransferase
LKIVPLQNSHKKQDFNCGKPLLDNYLHRQAKQDIKRKLAICFVLVDENDTVKGYYTLSSAGTPAKDIPVEISKKLPASYTQLPVTLMGRLAIDTSAAGHGYGKLLLLDALKKSYEVSKTTIGSLAVVVDPIDADAVRFYEKYGFVLLRDSGRMLLGMRTIGELFG